MYVTVVVHVCVVCVYTIQSCTSCVRLFLFVSLCTCTTLVHSYILLFKSGGIEYSEISREIAEKCNPDGTLLFSAIINYILY